jgi:hypothetical protein
MHQRAIAVAPHNEYSAKEPVISFSGPGGSFAGKPFTTLPQRTLGQRAGTRRCGIRGHAGRNPGYRGGYCAIDRLPRQQYLLICRQLNSVESKAGPATTPLIITTRWADPYWPGVLAATLSFNGILVR